jgi:hypothetical protein
LEGPAVGKDGRGAQNDQEEHEGEHRFGAEASQK